MRRLESFSRARHPNPFQPSLLWRHVHVCARYVVRAPPLARETRSTGTGSWETVVLDCGMTLRLLLVATPQMLAVSTPMQTVSPTVFASEQLNRVINRIRAIALIRGQFFGAEEGTVYPEAGGLRSPPVRSTNSIRPGSSVHSRLWSGAQRGQHLVDGRALLNAEAFAFLGREAAGQLT